MDQINVLSEMERIGYAYDWAGEEEIKCKCPFHDDSSPSCNINVSKRVFSCPVAGCMAKGDFITFLARALKTSRAVVFADLSKRYRFDTVKIIDPEVIERYHNRIWQAGPLLKELYARCVTDDMIRRHRLGENGGRVIIPVPNSSGLFVDLRKYLPGAPGPQKMKSVRGHAKMRPYPVSQLQYDDIVLVGGEIKAIVAADELNRHNIGAVTWTGGEGNWDQKASSELIGKRVWVALDIDEAGRKASRERCTVLTRVARWVGEIHLPLDPDTYPKGDVNDYYARGEKLKPLLDECPEFAPERVEELSDVEPTDMHLVNAVNAASAGKRVRIRGVVTVMDTAPYHIPKRVRVVCTRDQNECQVCPVYSGSDYQDINHESPAILEMMDARKSAQREALMGSVKIPRTCKVVEFEPLEYYNVEDARVSPQLEITNRSADRLVQPAVCIGDGLELNESYDFVGRPYPHPMTQQSTLLLSSYTPTQDALSTYVPRDLEQLRVFRPDEWTTRSLSYKLDDIYEDLETNVTHIYQRRSMHLFVDLAYHSPLLMTFDGRTVKGWVEVLILGDSSQGKSEVACGSDGRGGLMNHYGLGEKAECKNASVAGLLGGLQQSGKRWFVSWGVIPTHDKRLVILEELKGASQEVIAKLTDMRSSGVAMIDKIEKRRTHARTRLVVLSNPRSDHPMSTYNFGIQAVKELVGALEDVRRFDACLLVSSGEVDVNEINSLRKNRPRVRHLYEGELCRSLVLWAWTRTQDQVIFDDAATMAALDRSSEMCKRFTNAIPIVDVGSMRYKLARLSASLAARTFSTPEDEPDTLLVRACHVNYVADLLTRTYASPVFGYDDFTAAVRLTQELGDEEIIKKSINSTPFPRDFVKSVLHTDRIDVQDVQDWCGWERSEAQVIISTFVRKHAFMRDGRQYRKTAPFIHLLKHMLENGCLIADRPSHIEEEF